MDNKTMLEGILWDLKGLSDLFLHGTIESGTQNVHQAFEDALMDGLSLQNELYTLMSNEGMYQVENVSDTKLTKAQNKYDPSLKNE